MINKIVRRIIHVVSMDIVKITLIVNGVVDVNFGGTEHYVINVSLFKLKRKSMN
jgi:hypothetical protein